VTKQHDDQGLPVDENDGLMSEGKEPHHLQTKTPMTGLPDDKEDAAVVARRVMNTTGRARGRMPMHHETERARPGDQSKDDNCPSCGSEFAGEPGCVPGSNGQPVACTDKWHDDDGPLKTSGRLQEKDVARLADLFHPIPRSDVNEIQYVGPDFNPGPTELDMRDGAETFLRTCGLEPTPDAIDQLVEVFVPCLSIMCSRPWSPDGATWRKAGRLGALADTRKKFERLWERAWKNGKRHDDSGFDLINYVGFYLRADQPRWGGWGEPAPGGEDD
jgi:hypothetical protein